MLSPYEGKLDVYRYEDKANRQDKPTICYALTSTNQVTHISYIEHHDSIDLAVRFNMLYSLRNTAINQEVQVTRKKFAIHPAGSRVERT